MPPERALPVGLNRPFAKSAGSPLELPDPPGAPMTRRWRRRGRGKPGMASRVMHSLSSDGVGKHPPVLEGGGLREPTARPGDERRRRNQQIQNGHRDNSCEGEPQAFPRYAPADRRRRQAGVRAGPLALARLLGRLASVTLAGFTRAPPETQPKPQVPRQHGVAVSLDPCGGPNCA